MGGSLSLLGTSLKMALGRMSGRRFFYFFVLKPQKGPPLIVVSVLSG